MSLTATSPWRHRAALLALALSAILLGFHATYADMVRIWWTSSTFNHCFLIVPIAVYLGLHRRPVLLGLPPATSLWGVAYVLANGLLWLAGELMSIAFFQHVAAVGLLIGGSWALLGNRIFRVLLLPFLYLYFAVPEGEFLVPFLQDWTAQVLVEALRLTGIPVFIEGRYLSIPSGNFIVAEACSGINYLIATLAVGTMFMYLNFNSAWRRLAFMALAVAVPLLANGLRAYGIVMIAHLSDYKYAVGIDHFIYGWVFFGVVIFLLFAIGNRFSDVATTPPTAPEPLLSHDPRRTSGPAMLLLVLVCAAAPRALLAMIDSTRPDAPTIALPAIVDWSGPEMHKPALGGIHPGADIELAATYRNADGRTVIVELAYYRRERAGMELVNQTNALFDDRRWQQLDYGTRSPNADATVELVNELHLRAPDDSHEYLVWSWYDTGGTRTASRLPIKLAQARARLSRAHAGGAVMTVRTLHEAGVDGVPVLTAFLRTGALTLENLYEQH